MNKTYLNLLGLAYAARKIVSGETLLKTISKNKVYCVVIAGDASDNIKKKLLNKCNYYHVPYYIIEETSDILGKALGKEYYVAVGLTDKGFAKKIKEIIGG